MAMPDSVTVEVEFTAGVWTDVTIYLDGRAGGSTNFGRTSPFGTVAPGSLTLTLANEDGRFTPGRQVLSDGVTPHPYYPNVVPRKRIRVAQVVSGVPNYIFTGHVKGWPPTLVTGKTARVTITATTRDDQLARVKLRHLYIRQHIDQAAAAGGKSLLYLMNDPVTKGNYTASAYLEYNRAASPFVYFNFANPDVIGSTDSPLPASDGLTGAAVTNGGSTFYNRAIRRGMTGDFVVSAWITVPILNSGNPLLGTNPAFRSFLFDSTDGSDGVQLVLMVNYPTTPATGNITFTITGTLGTVTGTGPVDDGNPHHYAVRASTSGGTQTLRLYCDGVQVASLSGTAGLIDGIGAYSQTDVIASTASGYTNLAVGVGPISYYWGGAYSAAMVQALYAAGTGYAGDTSTQRLQRILGFAGLTAADWNLDAGGAVMGAQPIDGVDVVTAMQAVAVTEGGGAAVYVGMDGKVQFRSRSFRTPGAPVMTLDAAADLDGSAVQPVFDDTLIVNEVQASSGATGSSQVVDDAPSQLLYGLTTDSFTSYATSDDDVLSNAQDRLARLRNPTFQFGKVPVDLATATTPGLYAASAAAATIGARIRLSNLPATAAPTKTTDLYAEGWQHAFSADGFEITYDTSPADAPPWMVWDDASYGRWQASGCTLNAGITAAATTLAVATSAGNPTFTTDPTMYPLNVQIGAELITLTAAPGGSASPQTFTGVTRGVNGTAAAAQTAGSAVDLAPTSTWTL
jgi:hypothetical protein